MILFYRSNLLAVRAIWPQKQRAEGGYGALPLLKSAVPTRRGRRGGITLQLHWQVAPHLSPVRSSNLGWNLTGIILDTLIRFEMANVLN